MHIFAAIGLSVILVFIFFFIYLPVTTNHGESITVPDVTGIVLSDLDDFLDSRNLRFEVTVDSGYDANLPPLAVLKQVPKPNSKVKENRKIYVTLNSETPPHIKMPKLVGGSVKNAQLILRTYDLKLGEIKYVSDLALNYVLEQRFQDEEIEEGDKITKGSVIDLVVGDGLGKQSLESPNLIGLDQESAELAIVGSGLKIGEIGYDQEGIAVIEMEEGDSTYTVEEQVSPGAVFKQFPEPGKGMILKQSVNIWVYRPDSISNSTNLLDEL